MDGDQLRARITPELIEKYGERTFMYTEYPNARFWSREYKDSDYRAALKNIFRDNSRAPLMLYVHIPHCHAQCLFCTCHTVITRNYDDVKRYMRVFHLEIDMLKRFFEEQGAHQNIREIHLGGGSPTYLKKQEFDELIEKLGFIADVKNLDEFSIEIDPRHVKKDMMHYYREKGINRISFGIQDFDLKVQEAVGRVQPAELTERLITPDIRGLFKQGVNFDILCGLPYQTRETMRKTMERVVTLSPDRICLNYMHFAPEFSPHQLLMPAFPGNLERKLLFIDALEILSENGYLRIGYDHFAKPTDSLARALGNKTVQWNRLGVTPGRYTMTIGTGVSGVSMFEPDYYFQNVYETAEYGRMLKEGAFPIYRGYKLTHDDAIRNDVIKTLRNYFFVRYQDMEAKYTIDFQNYFAKELEILKHMSEDGLIDFDGSSIAITELGDCFADRIYGIFDRYTERKEVKT